MACSKKFSRRRFLKGGAATASAVAAATCIIPSRVLAAPNRLGANERIGIGRIGFGRRAGQWPVPPGQTRIVAVSDVNLKRAETLAAKTSCRVYQDYRKMLECKDVDAVVVATPEHWHALPCIHACQAGKDVYGENPLALTIREGQAMVEAVRKHQRVFQMGEQHRSHPAVRRGCELVRNGRIGKVHTVLTAAYPSPWDCNLPGQPIPTGLDWDMWCGQTEPRPYHEDTYLPRAKPGWISLRPYSGGEIVENGAHYLSPVQWGLGTDDTGPVEVWVEGDKFNPPVYDQPESAARGNAMCSKPAVFMRYASGVVLQFSNGPAGATFIGDKGKITVVPGRFTAEPAEIANEPPRPSDIRLYESNDHMQNWIDCIRSRKRPILDVAIGHRITTVCHLGNIARWLGRKLRWDPEKQIFPGDDEANQYLDRPKRKPYQLPDPL